MKTVITTLTSNAWVYSAGYHRNSFFTLPSGETAISTNNVAGTGGGKVNLSIWYESAPTAGTKTIGADNDLGADTPWTAFAVSLKRI